MDENIRNQLRMAYDKLLRDRKAGNKNGVSMATRCLMDLYPDNPFEKGSKPYDLFYIMGIQHHRWKLSNLPDCPGKREMNRLAGELADLNLPNPWADQPAVMLNALPESVPAEPQTKEENHGVFKRRKRSKKNDSQGTD